jgi:hypothetical protein
VGRCHQSRGRSRGLPPRLRRHFASRPACHR